MAAPIRLPTAQLVSREPRDVTVRWVLRATWMMLAALILLVMIGNHVPPG